MPISHGEQLFGLVRSLSKAEKRNFRLYARRIQGDVKFLALFDYLEKLKEFQEDSARKALCNDDKVQFSNLKRHLYQHILTSLRLLEVNKQEDVQIREWIDYASILYGKGMYLQALKMLNKAKSLASSGHYDFQHQEIIEFEKRIEARHITRASTERMVKLTEEAAHRGKVSLATIELSNLKLLLQRQFINEGHIRSEEERQQLHRILAEHMPRSLSTSQTFFEKVYTNQVYYWFHYLQLEYKQCLHYAQQWVNLYAVDPHMVAMDVDMYLIGLHHLLSAAFFLRDITLFEETLEKLESFRNDAYSRLNMNSRVFSFLFVHQARFNHCFLRGDFAAAEANIPRTLRRMKKFEPLLDPHKVLIFHYKIAWTYMGLGRPDLAVDSLNKLLNQDGRPLRNDLQAYAQLLFLMAQFDLRNFGLLGYLANNTYRFIQRMPDAGPLLVATASFFRSLERVSPTQLPAKLQRFHQQIQELQQSPFEKRAFAFLDVEAWVISKIRQVPLGQIVRERALQRVENQLSSK